MRVVLCTHKNKTTKSLARVREEGNNNVERWREEKEKQGERDRG